jgi:putative hemolysin
MLNLIFTLLSAFSCFAETATYQIYKDSKKVDIKTRTYKGLHLTADCFKGDIPKCDAFSATKKAVTPSKSATDSVGNPAARYCNDKNGVSRILITAKNEQFDYCAFNDGSMIDSWDLFNKASTK